MNDFHFRRLNTSEAERGYELLCETVAWLRAKGIRLWEAPLPREVYFARQHRGENYGLFRCAELAAIVSLSSIPAYWADCAAEANAPWLCTLATSNAFRGKSCGRRMVEMACEFLGAQGHKAVFLDCKPGFLERFYRDLGFESLQTRHLELAHASPCAAVEAVLMRKVLS